MICDVDHVIINLIKLRNEKMKNEHKVQIMHWNLLDIYFSSAIYITLVVNGFCFSNVFFDQLPECTLIYLHVCAFYKMLYYNIW